MTSAVGTKSTIILQLGKNICPVGKTYMPNGKKIYGQEEKNIWPAGKKYMASGKKIYCLVYKYSSKFM